MKNQPEPDEIEQQVIATVSSILKEEALWADNRSYLTRIIGSGKTDSRASNKSTINEEVWTNLIVNRLSALGKQLRFTVSGHQREWMYDVVWRDLNTSGDWWTTKSVPLVLCCNWYISGISGHPSSEPLDKLIVARAEHRVLICQNRYPGNVFDYFTSYIRLCEITKRKDRYLLLCYVPEQKRFDYCVFVV